MKTHVSIVQVGIEEGMETSFFDNILENLPIFEFVSKPRIHRKSTKKIHLLDQLTCFVISQRKIFIKKPTIFG